METIRVEPVSRRHGPALEAFFAQCDVACRCRYWHFDGDKNAWLDRLANAPGENSRELREGLEEGRSDAFGIAALEGERLVGWMKVTPADAVPKLYEQRLYKGLPCLSGNRDGIYTIGCVLIDPARRRRGLTRLLLRGAIDWVKSQGGRGLEAFPHRPTGEVADALLWTGPARTFVAEGFLEVHDFAPYPVLRLDLR